MSFENLSFEVTDAPPAVKGRGRARSNPFRAPLEESYSKDFAGTDEWYQFVVDTGDDGKGVERAINQIRSAGQMHPQIGTEVRPDRETGRIAFRGVEHKPREAKESENGEGSEEAGRHALDEEPALAEY